MAMGGGELRLRRVQSVEETEAALVLAKEYGQWAVRVAKSEYGIDAEAESEHGLSTSIGELLEPRGRLYLADFDGVAVGIGGLKPVSTEIAEVKRMYVRAAARGRGVGRQLLHRLLDDARALGFRIVRLESATFMREAHALYRSFGFAEVAPYEGSEFAAIPGAEKIQLFMALELGGGDIGNPHRPRAT
jgi:GNAT superfamily N-acetyltransferase